MATKKKIPVLERVIAARLEALIEEAGKSVRGLSLELGRPAHDLHRRISPDYADRRPLRFQDVEAICEALGVGPLAVFRPVLLGADLRILTWIGERQDGPRAALVLDVFESGAASLSRLIAQELVRESAGVLTLTPDGFAAVATSKEP